MIVFANTITPRLQYITDFIGKEICGKSFELTTDAEAFGNYAGPKINYSHQQFADCQLSLVPCPLLFETGIKEQKTACFEENNFKVFFNTDGDYPFDIFAACFYLLSRYEEYLPHAKDRYDRYAHENSLAFREGFLHVPLINIWLEDFKKVLKAKYSMLNAQCSLFKFEPTYDIDEAYAYKYKSKLRTIGGTAIQLARGNWQLMKERLNVLSGKSNDPYDSYQWMDEQHKKYNLKPIFFFHVAVENGKYDKNILPSHPAMQQLIKQHAEKYSIGIHPSWRSGDEENLLEKEIKTLENITGKKITASRQHYIRFTLPQTFRRLIEAGITDDYSMGYGSINGFRASVVSSFYWYDLEKEQETNLLLHPFCFMEANSFFEQKQTAKQTLEEWLQYYRIVKSVNGTFISIWHNSFLGAEKRFGGWRKMYEEFIKAICSPTANDEWPI